MRVDSFGYDRGGEAPKEHYTIQISNKMYFHYIFYWFVTVAVKKLFKFSILASIVN